ncbi:MAG: dihydrolipoamide acetyltransferase family protein, partial [Sulfurimonas sp.]
MYEIVMPQLSDSMDEGKLIAWKVSVGQEVKSGDVIAEVESDKAIMEVETFKDGIVKELLVKEGEEAKVGSVIARIETDKKSSKEEIKTSQEVKHEKAKQEETQEIQAKPKLDIAPKKAQSVQKQSDETVKNISPKARAKAAQYGIELQTLTQHTGKTQLHAQDVEAYMQEHYFTPKAQQLLKTYKLETSLFSLDHKIDATEVQEYIDRHEIPLPHAISSIQKAIINNVTLSAQKPVFHMYEHGDAMLLEQNRQHSITAWLIKIFATVMMRHETFRSRLYDESIAVYPNASIAVAVADAKELYMPVVKNANTLSIKEIDAVLKSFKSKLQTKSFRSQDMQGSTFGLSNLGMLGVERFDAMINKDDAAIMAVGGINEGEISLTLSADHRLIN